MRNKSHIRSLLGILASIRTRSTTKHITTSTTTFKISRHGVGISSELGQPAYWTHPHLFQPYMSATLPLEQQVTPGISRREFEERRDTYVSYLLNYQSIYFAPNLSAQEKAAKLRNGSGLAEATSASDSGGVGFIAVIPSAMPTFMSPDVPHTFKQNSDFLYLTGFREPDSALVISKIGKMTIH